MQIVFTQHAEEQLAARGISRAMAIEVALSPDQVVADLANNVLVAQSLREIGSKVYLVRIPFRDEGEDRHVITVYLTSQIKRYWQAE